MPSRYEIRSHRGKPTLFINGHPDPSYLYCYPLSLDLEGAALIHQKFAKHGCRYFTINVRGGVDNDWGTSAFWTDDNLFPDITDPAEVAANNLSRQAKIVLEANPDARIWIRYHSTPPLRWRKKNPDDLLLNAYGQRYDEPSLASESYITQVGKFVENIVRFVERQPWADRVVGYLAYPLGEGTTVLTCEGLLFDQSPAMQRGFREFLRRKYQTNAALRAAWGKPEVTFETAAIPNDLDFAQRGRTKRELIDTGHGAEGKPAPHRLHWPEPGEVAPERDYCLYARELTERNFRALLRPVHTFAPHRLAGIDAFKQTMLGWPLVARWAGDYETHSGAMHAVSGAFGMADLLDMPELDVVATPHDYLHRGMGFGYEGEGIGDSIVLHGKMMLMEEDQRTFTRNEGGRWNFLKDMDEVRAGLWRNLGSSVSRGYNTYPMDITQPSFFMDDRVQEVLGQRRPVHEAATWWDRRDVPSIVMVVDDWSVLEENFSIDYQYLAVIHQRMFGLSRCGVPFRLHLFEDLARPDFPDCHKVFLFPNLFRSTPERLDLLRRKVFRNGNVAIFGPASGITDGKSLSSETASALTGIPLRLSRRESPRFVTIDRFEHPITRDLPRLDFGDSRPFGPLLIPEEHPEVVRLGGIQWPHARDGAGLVLRKFGRGSAGDAPGTSAGPRGEGDWTSIFSAAVPLPDSLLRSIARFSGTHVYGESDDLIFADQKTLTVHSVRPGKRSIALPKATTVWDLIRRRRVGTGLKSIEIDVKPPQTEMFYLGEEDPFEVR